MRSSHGPHYQNPHHQKGVGYLGQLIRPTF
jgi:hypothetical protein